MAFGATKMGYDPGLSTRTPVADFADTGLHRFGEILDPAACAALLADLKAGRDWGEGLFLDEAAFDADPQHRGVNPRPGRFLLEGFEDRLALVEQAPAVVAGLTALLGEGFRMGIGLNSGNVMSGNVGSERRLEYTAIGDTTNTASRIEGMTKGTPHQLFLADATRERLKEPVDDLVRVGEFEVRGRTAKVTLWSLPDAPPKLRDGVAEPLEAG